MSLNVSILFLNFGTVLGLPKVVLFLQRQGQFQLLVQGVAKKEDILGAFLHSKICRKLHVVFNSQKYCAGSS